MHPKHRQLIRCRLQITAPSWSYRLAATSNLVSFEGLRLCKRYIFQVDSYPEHPNLVEDLAHFKKREHLMLGRHDLVPAGIYYSQLLHDDRSLGAAGHILSLSEYTSLLQISTTWAEE